MYECYLFNQPAFLELFQARSVLKTNLFGIVDYPIPTFRSTLIMGVET